MIFDSVDLFIPGRYDKGAYLFLPSYIMRTHGAKQQRDTVKRVPRNQLVQVFQVWEHYHFHSLLVTLFYFKLFDYLNA